MSYWTPEKFADLPLIDAPGYQYPSHDGDLAWLDLLADRMFCFPARHLAQLVQHDMWHHTIDVTGINPGQLLRYWPT